MDEYFLASERDMLAADVPLAPVAHETSAQSRWYALTTKPQHERLAARLLAEKNLEALLPLYSVRRRWSDRLKELQLPLFPGYVFCHFPYQNRVRVLNTPGVRSIVTLGRNPTPVADEEIAAIRRMLASGLPLQPWPFLKAGQKVRVERGPLAGVHGILLKVRNSWKVIVSVELLQRSVAVEIERDAISPDSLNSRN